MNKYRPLERKAHSKQLKAPGLKEPMLPKTNTKAQVSIPPSQELYRCHDHNFKLETGISHHKGNPLTLTIQNRQRYSPVPRAKIAKIVRIFLKLEGVDCDEVDISFISDKEMRAMHLEFFDDPSPTDCISFPIDCDEALGYKHLGEVIVCPEVACRYSSKKKLVYLDELVLYIIHGLLHLCGYDDLDPQPRKVMRKRERYHMDYLRLLKLI